MMHWGWSQFFGWKFSQLGTYLFWTLHLCRYQCPPPGPREFVMHFNSRRQIIAVLVRLRHKIWVACKAKSAPLPKNWLEASTARETLFTGSPRSQHSGIVRKQQVFSSSESALTISGMLRMSVHSCSILSEREAYDMWVLYQSAVQLYMFFFPGYKCSAGTHT